MLDATPFSTCKPQWGVRVNSVSSGLCQADLDAVLSSSNKPPCILLPKVESVDEILWVTERELSFLIEKIICPHNKPLC